MGRREWSDEARWTSAKCIAAHVRSFIRLHAEPMCMLACCVVMRGCCTAALHAGDIMLLIIAIIII